MIIMDDGRVLHGRKRRKGLGEMRYSKKRLLGESPTGDEKRLVCAYRMACAASSI